MEMMQTFYSLGGQQAIWKSILAKINPERYRLRAGVQLSISGSV